MKNTTTATARASLLAASLLLVGAGALSCGGGGGSDAPKSASKDDFCGAYSDLIKDIAAQATSGDEPDQDKMVSTLHDWADTMKDVGTPEGVSADARKGFELTIQQAEDIKASDLSNDSLRDLEADLSADEKKQVEAFNTYLTKECADALKDAVPTPEG